MTHHRSDSGWKRYSRQILFAPLGREGQERLCSARVAVVGCGALGSVQAEMMVRAGIGSLTIIDRDDLDATNLQRQSLFNEEDVHQGLPKAVAAERRLTGINSGVAVRGIVADLNAGNALELLPGHDLLLDGTDNFETRFLMNEAARKLSIPWIYGACVGSHGWSAVFLPDRRPCFQCLIEGLPGEIGAETCDTVGIIAPVVHWTAAAQVTEALKLIAGRNEALHGMLVGWDAWRVELQRIVLRPETFPGCSVCGDGLYSYLEGRRGLGTSVLCGRDSVMVYPIERGRFSLSELQSRLAQSGEVSANIYLLKMIVEGHEMVVFADGRGVIRGTRDPAFARALYARYVGC